MRKLFLRLINFYFKKIEILTEISIYKQKIINYEYELRRINLDKKLIPLEKIELRNKIDELKTFIINNKIDCENKLKNLQDKLYIYE